MSKFDYSSTFVALTLLFALFFTGVTGVSAQSESSLLTKNDCPDEINCSNNVTGDEVRNAILDFINIVLTFIGILAVAFIIYAGFLMMTAGGNEDQIESGKKIIIWAAIGILVILFAWVIIAFVIDVGTTNELGKDINQ